MKKVFINSLVAGAALLCMSGDTQATNSKVGTTAYSFLKIGVGARAVALGGAFTGLADDESALYYNPAGLVSTGKRAVTTSYVNYLSDIQSGFVGYIHPYTETQRFGVAVNYFNYGSFTGLDQTGAPTGDFTPSDLALAVSYAAGFKGGLQVGLSSRFVFEKIDSLSSTGLMFDLGALYKFKDGRTQAGVALQNAGFQLSGLTSMHKDDLPVVVRVGFAHFLRGLPLVFAADVAKPVDNDFHIDVGAEFLQLKPVYLRLGWSSIGSAIRTSSDNNKLAGFAGGFGVIYQKYEIDYAFVPYADLGSAHRVTVAARF